MSRPLMIRQVLLLGCLGATVAATLWTARQRSVLGNEASGEAPVTIARSVVTPKSPRAPMEEPVRTDLPVDERTALSDLRGSVDPFGVRSWQPAPPPPPPPPPAPPPPEPTAPALPFVYMGQQEQPGGKIPTVFYLTRGADFFAVVAGDAMGGDYRFDGLDQGVLRFTYLPLSVKQELNIGLNP